MTEEQRRKELSDKFKDLTGWAGDEEFRMKEKEEDAARICTKVTNQLDALLENTSLLALNNDQLAELLKKSISFTAELEAEARRRE